ncbi:hypothetical protein FALBO_1290 [Fusarium albosuccineum]|uniref:Uncharacterized protein n=1 Tax=Fusarium albosuccineum TaxID=1237068 RepID=A0A8H4LQE0_9HYPO|nr:hypothetical protein FALBO_1290 [Fusarium albosuccineum]
MLPFTSKALLCIDSLYNSPVFDSETEESSPIPHRKVSGRFNGTNIDFNIYLPKDNWEGRFFHLVYPLQSSTADDHAIAFGADSGGYTVQASGALGCRADAALAKLSRKVARDYYKQPSRQIFGYSYGGSGGSLQTIGGIENTVGVWDGCVTLIQAVPMSNPNNWPIRALSGLILTDKKDKIKDAFSPGGSGDPSPLLNAAESAAFEETTALGVPREAWEDFEGVGQNRTQLWDSLMTLVVPAVEGADPTYVDDFWTKSGYLGTEKSPLGDFFRASLVEFNTTVTDVKADGGVATEIVLKDVPANINTVGLRFTIQNKNGSLGVFDGSLDSKTRTILVRSSSNSDVLDDVTKGAELQVDNRWYLAVHTLHRHQVPPVESGFYGYDYLRKDGVPRYPQRDVLIAPKISKSASGGGTHTGDIKGKVIVMDNLLDFDTFPWHADWYKNQVKKALGSRFKDNYRLYYSDNADHFMGPVKAPMSRRLVDFTGLFEQYLRDLSAWVEGGVTPPKETQYTIKESQVTVPATASERGGIQPVVDLTVGGGKRIQVKVGQSVQFKIHAEAPPKTGDVVSVEWDSWCRRVCQARLWQGWSYRRL